MKQTINSDHLMALLINEINYTYKTKTKYAVITPLLFVMEHNTRRRDYSVTEACIQRDTVVRRKSKFPSSPVHSFTEVYYGNLHTSSARSE